MSSTSGSGSGGRGDWPFEGIGEPERPPAGPGETRGGGRHGSGGGHGNGERHGTTGPARRRPPLWALIAAGVAVVALVVVGVIVATRGGPVVTPEAEVVTLPVPTPTVEPVAREGGSAFFQSLPSTFLAFALAEAGEHEPLLVAGALEGYRLVYTDGARAVTVYAGQWADAAGAEATFDQIAALAALPAEAAPTPSPSASTEPLPEPEQGPVEVGGEQVGRYMLVAHADGTGSAWWTNGSVLIQIDGPYDALHDAYAAFPL